MERTLLNEVLEFLVKELENREEMDCYACDLASILTEYSNCDGTIEYSTNETIEKIRAYWWEYSSVFEYAKDNWGLTINPFENPEKFDVIAYIVIAEELISRCNYIDKKWNKKITLTKSVIKKINRQINTVAYDLKEYEY